MSVTQRYVLSWPASEPTHSTGLWMVGEAGPSRGFPRGWREAVAGNAPACLRKPGQLGWGWGFCIQHPEEAQSRVSDRAVARPHSAPVTLVQVQGASPKARK